MRALDGTVSMTLMILLGGVAALYLVWLMFRLASLALPVCFGIYIVFLLRDHGHGPFAAIAIGAMMGIALHEAGRALLARSGSSCLRLLIILLFAGPAGFAGMEVGAALAELIGIDGFWRVPLILGFGASTTGASWRLLAADRSSSNGARQHRAVR